MRREKKERSTTTGRRALGVYPTDRPDIDKHRDLSFPEWARRFLRIRNLEGKLVPFELNPIQLKLDVIWEEELSHRGYVRLGILKARKEGVSSYVQGRAIREIVERPGWRAGVMAHEDDSCAAIFNRTQTFAENLPEELRRTAHKWNKKEIAYKPPHDSGLEVNVAKGRGGWARGSDKHFVHLSEMAFWPIIRGESSAQGQYVAILGAVPDAPGTAVVVETTANGAGNAFHRFWKAAVNGDNDFRPVFFSWQDFPAYRLSGKKAEDFPAEKEALEDEPTLRALGCDEEQLAWRRWKIRGLGSVDAFRQEFPHTPEVAFLATGLPVFTPSVIQRRILEIEKREKGTPPGRFSFRGNGSIDRDEHGELATFRSVTHNDDLFKDPERLVIVADPAGHGTNAANPQKGDPCCAYLWDRAHNEQIAELHGWMDPDDFAERLVWLGRLYKNPLMVIEAGPWGGHVLSLVKDRFDYPRIYFRDALGDTLTTKTDWSKIGWATTGQTKPRMVDALRDAWNNDHIIVNSLECCREHLTFVKNGVKREAQAGAHDDRVMVCAIYAAWALQHPYSPPAMERKYEKPNSCWTYFGCDPVPKSRGGALRLGPL